MALRGQPKDKMDHSSSDRATDHLANERTYLAWVRTSVTIMALGFVVAKFGLIIRELSPSSVTVPTHISSAVGVILVLIGGVLQGLAFRRFRRNRARIIQGNFESETGMENVTSSLILLISVLLVVYLIITA